MLKGLKHLTPSEFAKFYFDFNPYPYQKEALNCQDKNIQLAWSRQTGKSTVSALTGLYDALMHDNWTIVILAPKEQQARRMFKKIKNFITYSAHHHPELKLVEYIDRETKTLFEFKNGSEILSLTIGEDGNNIRGLTAHVVIIDESADVRKQEVWSSINPMTLATHGRKRFIGTLKGINNLFYKIYKNPSEYYFTKFEATSDQNPSADLKEIENDRKIMSLAMWNQEYKNIPMEEADSFFPTKLVQKIIADYDEHETPLSQYDYYLGVDPAGEGLDSTVYCILQKTPGKLNVARFVEIKNQTLPQIEANIRILHQLWNFKKILIDTTGGRNIDQFLTPTGIPAQGFQFTVKSKQEVYQYLKQVMQAGTLNIYKHDECIKQLLDMRYEPINQAGTGFLKIFSGQSKDSNMPGGDDYPTALVLAVYLTATPRTPILYGTTKSLIQAPE